MFMFKAFVVGTGWKREMGVEAFSLEEATQKLHQAMWWDCYSPSEYELSFVGKSKLS